MQDPIMTEEPAQNDNFNEIGNRNLSSCFMNPDDLNHLQNEQNFNNEAEVSEEEQNDFLEDQ